MRKLLVVAMFAALAACTPKPAPVIIPTLPGDGAEHTAKPPPVIVKPVVDDPWAGKTLIPPPTPIAAGKVDLPPLEEYTLKNGLKVYAVKSDRLPVMSFQLAVRAGRLGEPRARLGVSELTADLLVKGTQRRDAKAIAQAIDAVGGTITADSTFEATLLSCSVVAKDSDTCLDLLPDIVEHPVFSEQELTKQRDALIGAVHQRLEDAASLASLHVQELLWGPEHVRGWVNSERSVSALRREDLVAWHKTWYMPNNAMLVVTGDFDPKKMRDRLERAFGGWAKGSVPPLPSYGELGLSGIRIRLVDKPGQTQTHIRVAQFGIKHDDPRFFDTVVWNYILGGGGASSRLMRAARTDAGKAYGASTSFDRNTDKGSFVAQSFARNADAVAATKLMIAELAKMHDEGPTPEEVAAAAANISGAWGLRFQSVTDIGRRARGRGAARLRHGVSAELRARDHRGRRRVGEARGRGDHRPEELRHRARRRREGSRAAAQARGLAVREGRRSPSRSRPRRRTRRRRRPPRSKTRRRPRPRASSSRTRSPRRAARSSPRSSRCA